MAKTGKRRFNFIFDPKVAAKIIRIAKAKRWTYHAVITWAIDKAGSKNV